MRDNLSTFFCYFMCIKQSLSVPYSSWKYKLTYLKASKWGLSLSRPAQFCPQKLIKMWCPFSTGSKWGAYQVNYHYNHYQVIKKQISCLCLWTNVLTLSEACIKTCHTFISSVFDKPLGGSVSLQGVNAWASINWNSNIWKHLKIVPFAK